MTYGQFKEVTSQELSKPLIEDREALDLYLAYREYYYTNSKEEADTLVTFIYDVFGNWETDTHGNELNHDRLNTDWEEF